MVAAMTIATPPMAIAQRTPLDRFAGGSSPPNVPVSRATAWAGAFDPASAGSNAGIGGSGATYG
jgi:hypothetical protein